MGVTGAPGSGKSSLVARLAAQYRAQGTTVGIIAVDPTSPFTGGAILGDRIRMQGHATDGDVFIRSMATRGVLGGLARAASDVALVLDAAGKQIVLIETVGVGQDEIDIMRLADCTLVLLVPGFGDDVQSMKAGLMEVADIFVINKSDRDGADRLEQQVAAMLELMPDRENVPAVVRTVATTGGGLGEVCAAIEEFRARLEASGQRRARAVEKWKRRLLAILEEELLTQTLQGRDSDQMLESLASEVADRVKDPYTAVRELMDRRIGAAKTTAKIESTHDDRASIGIGKTETRR